MPRNKKTAAEYYGVNYQNLDEERKAIADAVYENYIADSANLDADYAKESAALNSDKSVATQQANINHQIMLKYLPTVNKMNGLHGLGVSQSATIEALAGHQNALSDIDKYYRASKDTLDKSYRDSRTSLDRGIQESALDLYGEQAKQDREDATNAYKEAYDMITAGVGTMTREEVKNYIDKLNVDETTKERLGNIANYLYPEVKTPEGSEFGANATISGDKVTVDMGANEVGSIKVDLTLGEPVALPKEVVSSHEGDEAFEYNGSLYVKKNGVIYRLFGKDGTLTDDTYTAAYEYLTTGETDYGPIGPYLVNDGSKDSEPDEQGGTIDIEAVYEDVFGKPLEPQTPEQMREAFFGKPLEPHTPEQMREAFYAKFFKSQAQKYKEEQEEKFKTKRR